MERIKLSLSVRYRHGAVEGICGILSLSISPANTCSCFCSCTRVSKHIESSDEGDGKNKPGQRRTTWIDNVRQWAVGAVRIALEIATA